MSEEIVARLRELAEQLRDPEIDDEQAADLAREASDLIDQVGADIDRRLVEAAESGQVPPPDAEEPAAARDDD